jgi:hypothetical protein
MTSVFPVPLPANSQIIGLADGAYFSDAYEMPMKDSSSTALAIYLKAISRTPAWIEGAMSIRNRVVSFVGIKDIGGFKSFDKSKPAADYRVGDRVGVFTLQSMSDEEVVLADCDKHLDAKISARKTGTADRPTVTVSTVVHVHNALGRLYLVPVVPAHRIIVPAMMRLLENESSQR